ncbi:3-oxoacyl-ACP reductase [Streptococcus pneumoniae]|uniref:SDR family NAD(P)-dependent oxidoreductase n=1 Tax=Stutzerimonas stutzeri TaxID=316 RepID=A0AA40RW43_STUST|nr:SDR family oxidoreductase [Stutzerimonas stutzeri]CJL66497.1 3-oxoacyl-ACP reductase [Streptococcus pneumoniae]HAJ85883.1 KR domain-containing protein [Pseudomonas sp.]MBA1306549.1 SDR family NAD(P)-dependent oxidoreductase [Stutzerimonas stutzeri]MCQ4226023.1 SDR family oxidoreductase [Stutzerimonas stutzeri]MDH0444494.1 SDR family oxidoreductase [Stutzerimonas stutzeri]
MGILNGRVAIITGAGGGLGAAHARVFAAEGACVVVNDINQAAAQKVVDEILAAGGKAVANTSDITHYSDSENAVKQAIESFGDLHVVVNNAGINRDRMFASMTEAEWDAIMSVHLKGHFCISSHAVHYWRDQSKAGKAVNARIINTTSGAGLQGSIGQSNYAAAKAGIAALTLNQAAELGRYGITANAVAPAARTGMTTAVESMAARMAAPDDGSFDYWAPENVSSLLAWLASEEAAHITGRVFESEGGKISIADGWRTTQGVDKGDRWQPAEVGEAMQALLAAEVPAQKVYGS